MLNASRCDGCSTDRNRPTLWQSNRNRRDPRYPSSSKHHFTCPNQRYRGHQSLGFHSRSMLKWRPTFSPLIIEASVIRSAHMRRFLNSTSSLVGRLVLQIFSNSILRWSILRRALDSRELLLTSPTSLVIVFLSADRSVPNGACSTRRDKPSALQTGISKKPVDLET